MMANRRKGTWRKVADGSLKNSRAQDAMLATKHYIMMAAWSANKLIHEVAKIDEAGTGTDEDDNYSEKAHDLMRQLVSAEAKIDWIAERNGMDWTETKRTGSN